MSDFLRFQTEISQVMEQLVKPRLGDELTRLQTKPAEPFRIDLPFLSDEPASLAPYEQYSADMFRGFYEIRETVERLKDLEVYIRRFPFAATRITRERYLRVHIELYFHELYILQERLTAYAKRVTRSQRSDAIRAASKSAGKELESLVLERMSASTEVRHHHVHKSRFDETRLSNLGGIELIARNSDEPMWNAIVKQQYMLVRRYWSDWVTEMNGAIELLLDRYFAILYPILFIRTAKIREPSKFVAAAEVAQFSR